MTNIRTIERRYYLLIASVFALDLSISLIFMFLTGSWFLFLRNLFSSTAVYLAVNLFFARRLFVPIKAYLAGQKEFASIERNLTQLPLRSATRIGILTLMLMSYRIFLPFFLPEIAEAGLPNPTLLDAVFTVLVLGMFYFTYTYFVVSDYLAYLGRYIFERWQANLSLHFGRFAAKLLVALLVTSVLPLLLILNDIYAYDADRARVEVLVDIVSALFGIGVSAFFIARSLNRPLMVLNSGIRKVADGNFGVRLPVTSNDEVGLVTGEFNRMVDGLREREFIRETFGKYVSESVATQILNDRGLLAGEVREATLMFIDIEGFTTLSERLEPRVVIGLLNEYAALALDPVRRHGGVINNFIGDGLFASFNLPMENPTHTRSAVLAAVEIARAIGDHEFTGGHRLNVRIGINTGSVVAGTVGSAERLTYSILGDAVNIAHRIEELNKPLKTRILVSETTVAKAGQGLAFRDLGEQPIRGREQSIRVFSPSH